MKKHSFLALVALLGILAATAFLSWNNTQDSANPNAREDTRPPLGDNRGDSLPANSIVIERHPAPASSTQQLEAAVDAEQLIILVDAETDAIISTGVIVSEDRKLYPFDLAKGKHVSSSTVPRIFAVWSEGYIPMFGNLPQSGEFVLGRDPGIIVSTNLDSAHWEMTKSFLSDSKSGNQLEIELFNILAPYLVGVVDSDSVWLPGWPFWCSAEILAHGNEGRTAIPVVVPPCRGGEIYARRASISPSHEERTIVLESPNGTPRANVTATVFGIGRGKARTKALSDKTGEIHFPYDLNTLGKEVVRVQAQFPKDWSFWGKVHFAENQIEEHIEIGEADFIVDFGQHDVSNYEFAIAAAWIPENRAALFGAQPSLDDLIWISASSADLDDGSMRLISGWHGQDSCLVVRSKVSETVLAAFEIIDGEEFFLPEILKGMVVIECERENEGAWGYLVEMVGQSQSLQAPSGSDFVHADGTSQESTVELTLPPGEYALTVFEGAIPYPEINRFRVVNGETTRVHIKAPPMKEVDIVVEAPNGKAIPNAILFFYENPEDEPSNYGLKATCNQRGAYLGPVPEELKFCRAGSNFAVNGGYDRAPILSALVPTRPDERIVVSLDIGWITITGLPVTQTYLGRNNASSVFARRIGERGYFRVPLSQMEDSTFELPGGDYEIWVGSGTSEYIASPYTIGVMGGENLFLNFSNIFGGEVFFLELLTEKSKLKDEVYFLEVWVDNHLFHEERTKRIWLQESKVLALPLGQVKIVWQGLDSTQENIEFYSGGHGSYRAIECSDSGLTDSTQ